LSGPLRDLSCRHDNLRGTQHVIIEGLELRVAPKPASIASRHADDMRQPGYLSDQMPRYPVWLQIVGIYDMERVFSVHTGGDTGELRDEWACHRDVRLRGVDGVGPVHRNRTFAVLRLAPLPILRPHVHAIWRTYLFGIGHHVNVVTAHRKRV